MLHIASVTGEIPNQTYQELEIQRTKFISVIYSGITFDFIDLKLLSIVACFLVMLRRPSNPLTSCIIRKKGGGDSPGKVPKAVGRGGSFDHGSGAQSEYFVLRWTSSSLGNNGIAVFSPPGITPDTAALMKWFKVGSS